VGVIDRALSRRCAPEIIPQETEMLAGRCHWPVLFAIGILALAHAPVSSSQNATAGSAGHGGVYEAAEVNSSQIP
jgi:hypothetical protein